MPRVAAAAASEPRGRRRRNTIRAANMAMLACIDETYQALAAEALAGVIRRQSQAGKLCTCPQCDDDIEELRPIVAESERDTPAFPATGLTASGPASSTTCLLPIL